MKQFLLNTSIFQDYFLPSKTAWTSISLFELSTKKKTIVFGEESFSTFSYWFCEPRRYPPTPGSPSIVSVNIAIKVLFEADVMDCP